MPPITDELKLIKENAVAATYQILLTHALIQATWGFLRQKKILSAEEIREICDLTESTLLDVGLDAVADLDVDPNRAEAILNRTLDIYLRSLRSGLGS
jgi:hypothetical protein